MIPFPVVLEGDVECRHRMAELGGGQLHAM
jgi:hypothetical protein